jgi:hypothetical protein
MEKKLQLSFEILRQPSGTLHSENLGGALHADGRGCTLSMCREVKKKTRL